MVELFPRKSYVLHVEKFLESFYPCYGKHLFLKSIIIDVLFLIKSYGGFVHFIHYLDLM